MAIAPQNLPQFNSAGNMQTVLHGSFANVVLTAAQTLYESAISGFPAGWVAPLPGVLFSISGAMKSAANAALTVNVAININGTASGFSTTPLAPSGAIQIFSAVAGAPFAFNAGDIITMAAQPSATMIASSTISAALAVLM